MSKEFALVLLLCHSRFDKYIIRRVEHLLKSGIDWLQVFNLSVKCQTAYLVYSVLRDLHFLYLVPKSIRNFWSVSYSGNVKRNLYMLGEQKLLMTEFQKKEIPIYPVRGIILLKFAYADIGTRYLNDIDFIFPHQYCIHVLKTIEELKFNTLYINDTDPYLVRFNKYNYHSFFCIKKANDLNEMDFCCDFSFSEFEEYPNFFQFIAECLAMNEFNPKFHLAHILLLYISYYQIMKHSGFPKSFESENLVKLIDVQRYISHYFLGDLPLTFKQAIKTFHLNDIISYVDDCIRKFESKDVLSWI